MSHSPKHNLNQILKSSHPLRKAGLYTMAALLGITCMPAVGQHIVVHHNGSGIQENSATTSYFDNTKFGRIFVNFDNAYGYFTITNTAAPVLTIGTIVITGANAADFTVTAQPSITSIPTKAEANFTIKFDPSAAGVRTATVNIPNNDDGPFAFTVEGTGITETPPQSNDLVVRVGPKSTIKHSLVNLQHVTSIKSTLEVANAGYASGPGKLQVFYSADEFLFPGEPVVFEAVVPALPDFDSDRTLWKKFKLNLQPPSPGGYYFVRVQPDDPDSDGSYFENQVRVLYSAFQ